MQYLTTGTLLTVPSMRISGTDSDLPESLGQTLFSVGIPQESFIEAIEVCFQPLSPSFIHADSGLLEL